MSSRIYDWSVFEDQNHFLTEEYNFEATTTGCWHHLKCQGQVPKEYLTYGLARIQECASAAQIVKGVDVLVAIRWLQEAWKEITNLTIKNCFEKCGIKRDNELMEVEDYDDLEFEALLKEFTTDISAAEYANFDENVPASEPMINEFEIDWRQRVREDSINAIQNPEITSDQVE